jgi:microcystin-dependent protein
MPWQFFTSAGKEKVVEADPNPIGLITPFAGATAPTGWLLCQGQEISRSTYPNLDAALGLIYGTYTNGSGGAGSTHFKLPDLRGRASLGRAAGSSLNSTGTGAMGAVNGTEVSLGATEGQESVTLTAAQSGLPAHSHTASSTGTHNHAITNTNHNHVIYYRGGRPGVAGSNTAVRQANGNGPDQSPMQSVGIGASVVDNTTGITITDATAAGAASAHNNMQGYLVTNFIIKAL